MTESTFFQKSRFVRRIFSWTNEAFSLFILCLVLLVPTPSYAVTLHVLEWEGYISPYAKDFEKWAKTEKGIDVTLEFIKPYATNPEQFFLALRKEEVDVVTPTHNYYQMYKLPQILVPLDYDRLENYKDITPTLRTAKYDEMEGRKYSIPLVGGSYGLAYNESKTTEPVSWDILWNPESRGKYSITSDQFEANVYLCMLMAGYSPQEFYDIDSTYFNRLKIQQLLNTLVLNAHSFWRGMADTQAMTDLKYTTTYWVGVRWANRQGQKWDMATPAEGQTVWLDTIALSNTLLKDRKKLDAAYLLLDFMISPKIQKRLHEQLGLVIVNRKTADLMSLEQIHQSQVGNQEFFQEKWFWRPLSRRTRNMYKLMWQEAMELREVLNQ